MSEHPEERVVDPVIEAYKKDIDRTLLRENLKLSIAERVEKHQEFAKFIENVRGCAHRAPSSK